MVSSHTVLVWTFLTLASTGHGDRYPDCINGPLRNNEVCRSSSDPAKRAAALVEAMTIEEKLANLVDHSLGAERLGLPKYDWWNEALHGVGFSPGVKFSDSGDFSSATSFPNPITISATFDDELVGRVGAAIGAEARAFGNTGHSGLDFWTPNINPFKDPRWGRGLETPGEDPLRISNYIKHLLSGLEWAGQNGGEKRQIIATCKHYAAYDLERWNGHVRYSFDAIVSMQDLVEYYLPPFKQCARDSNVGSMMCSYNRVNGTPACANEYLMQTVLREHWNWTKHNNYIVSDCNAVHNIYADHKWLKTAAQAAGVAYTAGTDNICEAGGWATDVVGAYNQSLLSKEVIDRALRRQYEGLIRTDYFSSPGNTTASGFRAYGHEKVNTKEADNLARNTATDGIVLLKNDGILPLSPDTLKNQTIAVIGMWANDTVYRMLGNYFGRPPHYSTPLLAAQKLGLNVIYADGPVAGTPNFTAIFQAALAADIVIYFGGIDISVESEDLDRTSVSWPQGQISLIHNLSARNKPIIVVQLGTSLDNDEFLNNYGVNAMLWAGYPGMHGGSAVWDILTGAKAPAGRLPITQYPAGYAEKVPMTDMSLRPTANNPGRTYKWYNKAVQEFGFGLHYTNFTIAFGPPYSNRTSSARVKRNPPVFQGNLILADCKEQHKELCAFPSFPIVVTNHGNTTSDYIALAFVSTKQGPAPHPIKELASYKRLRDIKPGESRTAGLEFTIGNFARVNERGDTVLYDGAYCLELDVKGVLKNEGDEWWEANRPLEKLCFEILGGEQVLDTWPQPKAGNSTKFGK